MRAADKDDIFYRTVFYEKRMDRLYNQFEAGRALGWFERLIKEYESELMSGFQENGYIFGCVAVRCGHAFMVSKRGKTDLYEKTIVCLVYHSEHLVYTFGGKASLNAPLLDRIFDANPEVNAIVHYHDNVSKSDDMPNFPYHHPGTVADSIRDLNGVEDRFRIEDHGVFILIK